MEHIEIGLPVHFFSAGQFVARDGWIHGSRRIDTSVLFLVKSGRFRLREEDRCMDLCAGQAVILRSGVPHCGEAMDSDTPPVYYWAHFSSDSDASTRRIRIPQHSTPASFDMLVILFHQLISQNLSDCNPLASDLLMSLLLVHLSEHESGVQPSEYLYIRMKEYLRLNCSRTVTLQELSDTFRYSPDYLSRIFRRCEGMTIRQYQHSLRLIHARQLLVSTTSSIKEIASLCGYGSESFFVRTFEKFQGISPAQYRSQFCRLHQNTN